MRNICVLLAVIMAFSINCAVAAKTAAPMESAYVYTERASNKFMQKDINGAIEDMNRAIKVSPNNPELYLNRGYLKQVLNDLDGAMADYNESLRIAPTYAYAYNNRGVLKVELNDIDGALSDYEKAINLKNNYADVYYNRGNLKYMLGDNNGALADFDTAIQLNPKDADAYNNRGVVKKRMNYNVGALSDYSQAIALNPNDSIAYANRGHLKKLYFDNEGAAIDLNQAVALAENQVFIKNVKPLISRDNYITAIPVVNGITKTPVTARSNKLIAESLHKQESNNEKIAKYETKKPVNNIGATTRSLVESNDISIKTAYVQPKVESQKTTPQNNDNKLKTKPTTQEIAQVQQYSNTPSSKTLNAGVATVKAAVPQTVVKANPMVTPTTNIKLAESYYIRGLQKCILRDLQGAMADLDKAIANNAKYADAYFYRGAIKKELGDMDGFRSDYTNAIKINPSLQSFNSSNALALLQ